MKLISPSVEIWEQNYSSPVEDMWKHIARCTRVCYQSEKRNDKETEEEFVKRVIIKDNNINKIHGAMLEHGTIYLKIDIDVYDRNYNFIEVFYDTNPYSRLAYDRGNCYISTNLRVLIENNRLDDLKYICAPTEFHTKRITVSFITNIGVTREFNRHRVNSIAEESTRYCNYNLNKFDKSITFCLPSWIKEHSVEVQACRPAEVESDMYAEMRLDNLSDNWNSIDWYLYALSTCAFAYKKLIKLGLKPQQAREVLPLATKSQLIHTAFVDDWKHFIALRADGVSGTPHPNASFLAKQLKEQFIKRNLL